VLVLWWLACADPSPSPAEEEETSYVAYPGDTTTADTGPGLGFDLLHEDGTALAGQAARWTMVHGPAGGWSLTLHGELHAQADTEVYLQVSASALADGDVGFTVDDLRLAAATDATGDARFGPWPDPDVRLFPTWSGGKDDRQQICDLAGRELPLVVTLDPLDPDTLAFTPGIEVRGTVELLLDPYDTSACGVR